MHILSKVILDCRVPKRCAGEGYASEIKEKNSLDVNGVTYNLSL